MVTRTWLETLFDVCREALTEANCTARKPHSTPTHGALTHAVGVKDVSREQLASERRTPCGAVWSGVERQRGGTHAPLFQVQRARLGGEGVEGGALSSQRAFSRLSAALGSQQQQQLSARREGGGGRAAADGEDERRQHVRLVHLSCKHAPPTHTSVRRRRIHWLDVSAWRFAQLMRVLPRLISSME